MRPLSRLRRRSSSVAMRSPRTVQHRQPRREQDHVVLDRLDEKMVEPDLAELVDDDDRVGERRVLEQAVQQRRLARAEEAGEDGERDGRGRGAVMSGHLRSSFEPGRRWVSRHADAGGRSSPHDWRRSRRARVRRREAAAGSKLSPRITVEDKRRDDRLGADRRSRRTTAGSAPSAINWKTKPTTIAADRHRDREAARPARLRAARAATGATAAISADGEDDRRGSRRPWRRARCFRQRGGGEELRRRRDARAPAASARPRQSRSWTAGPTTSTTPATASATTARSAGVRRVPVDERAREHDQDRKGVEEHGRDRDRDEGDGGRDSRRRRRSCASPSSADGRRAPRGRRARSGARAPRSRSDESEHQEDAVDDERRRR